MAAPINNVTTYTLQPFYAGKSQPNGPNDRLSKAVWKGRGVTPRQSLCASVPRIDSFTEEEVSQLLPYFIDLVETVQDRLLKDRAEQGAEEVSEEEISVSAVATYLEEQQKGTRLSKEEILAWFDTFLAGPLHAAIVKKITLGKKPTPVQSQQAVEALGEYKERLSSLAGGRTEYPEAVAEKLQKAVDLLDLEEDAIADKLHRRLEAMIVKAQRPVNLLDL